MPRINTDNLTRCVETLDTALVGLRGEDPGSQMYNVFRGASMNEFQVVLDLTASLLRRRLRPYFATSRQVNELTFRRVFREAAKVGLISTEECQRWLGYRERRNVMAHRYGREFAQHALEVLPSLVEDGRRIADVIGAETDEE